VFRVIAALVASFGVATIHAAPPPPPGGPHPIYHGGDNQAGFPSLTFVGVDDPEAAAPALRLSVAAAPNPSRGEVRFRIQAPRGGALQLRIYSVSGRRVREWRSTVASGGWVDWRWDGRDQRGARAANGVYFYRCEMEDERISGRLVLLR
jgi:hypothetical protein